MIISASRRTDIPAYYADWLVKRVQQGFVYVRNPMNARQISKVSLSPDVVDAFVFWTKNPEPMLDKLDALRDSMYYFQFTLNSYGADVERGVPNKGKVIVPAFQRLADAIGPDRVIWRYDPIFLSQTYTMDYHIRYFEELAKKLSPYTRRCTFSFIDFYRNAQKNIAALGPIEFTPEKQEHMAKNIAGIAHSYGLRVDTCAENIDLDKYGIEHARCIDDRLLGKLLGFPLSLKKDRNQRKACGCVESVDIGAYNTCRSGCRYCYASFNEGAIGANNAMHNPDSPLLIGEVGPEDRITERRMISCGTHQLHLDI